MVPDQSVWCSEADRTRLHVFVTGMLPLGGEGVSALLEQLLKNEGHGLEVSLNLAGKIRAEAPDVPGLLAGVLRAVQLSGTRCCVLDISENSIGDDSAAPLAQFLSQQASLQELHLRDNKLTARGLIQLCLAIAGHPQHAYPRMDADGTCAPCWLDLRGNAIEQPQVVMRLCQSRGVTVCPATRCSRQRCAMMASVHLTGGLSRQVQTAHCSREELLALLGSALPPWQPVRRRVPMQRLLPAAPLIDNPPQPDEPASVAMARANGGIPAAPPGCPPVDEAESELEEDDMPVVQCLLTRNSDSSAAHSSGIPTLQAHQCSPLARMSPSIFDEGQLVRARSEIEAKAGLCTFYRVLRSSPLVTAGLGLVQVISVEGPEHPIAQWMQVDDLVVEPTFL